MSWEINNKSGWGVLGLNIFFQWARDSTIVPLSAAAIGDDLLLFVDPLRLSVVSRAIKISNDFVDVVIRSPGAHLKLDATVIDPISQSDPPSRFFGKRNIARCIFDNSNIKSFEIALGKFDAVLCASNWNADFVRARTNRPVSVIYEGIDPSLFCPGSRSGLMSPDKFYIFSGGKIEYRKGQDLVLRAFREFSKHHDDAVLVTAWHSPWPHISVGFKGTLDVPLELDDRGFLNVKKWVADNEIDPSRVVEMFSTSNQLMPTVLREMDVALQPSRAEPCTNLPAMEAMACGLPVIVANNTGVKDLVGRDNCVPLNDQRAIPTVDENYPTDGWGESSIDEIVDALEKLYVDKARRENLGASASRWIREHRTWQKHASELKDLVVSLD